jgi:CubicO group peptidase (beta-lactamase class C family)
VALIDDIAGDFRWPRDVAWHGQPPLPLAAAMAHAGVPAVSVAVITGGEVSETAAWGVACAGESPAATAGTLFQAASISKPVAAACALRLVADGAFGLDEPVDERLRSWQVPANGTWRPRLTVRQLLSHTAGLTASAFPGYPPGAAIPSLTDVLAGRGNTLPVRVSSLPGAQFSYSGGGYCVLQQLLTDVTGLPFPELATELVLGPAGMLDSAYAQPLPAGRQGIAAAGHRNGPAPVAGRWHVYPEMAAAGLWSTPADLARFAIAIQRSLAAGASDGAGPSAGAGGGSDAGGALLPAELAALMIEPAAPNVRCGLGLFSEGSGGSLRFGHTGGNEGFTCEMAGYAGAGIGAVVMTNADAGLPLVKGVLAAIARAGDWPGYPEGTARPPTAGTAADPAGAAVAAGLDESRAGIALAGDYELGETLIRVREQDGLLTLQAGQQPPVELVPSGAGRWAALELNLEVRLGDGGAGESRPELVLRQDAPFTTEAMAIRRVGQAG